MTSAEQYERGRAGLPPLPTPGVDAMTRFVDDQRAEVPQLAGALNSILDAYQAVPARVETSGLGVESDMLAQFHNLSLQLDRADHLLSELVSEVSRHVCQPSNEPGSHVRGLRGRSHALGGFGQLVRRFDRGVHLVAQFVVHSLAPSSLVGRTSVGAPRAAGSAPRLGDDTTGGAA